jgi:hypothetical protein
MRPCLARCGASLEPAVSMTDGFDAYKLLTVQHRYTLKHADTSRTDECDSVKPKRAPIGTAQMCPSMIEAR